jgi:putative membrane protein
MIRNTRVNFRWLYCLIVLFSPQLALADTSSLSDGEIVGIYNQVNSFDVEASLLAITRGSSEQVRDLATMVSTDHRQVRLGAAELARKLKLEVRVPAATHEAALVFYKTMEQLSKKNGSEFDSAYLLNEIKFHKTAIDAVENTLMPEANDTQLKQHFESVLPHFKRHLAAALKLARDMGFYRN